MNFGSNSTLFLLTLSDRYMVLDCYDSTVYKQYLESKLLDLVLIVS